MVLTWQRLTIFFLLIFCFNKIHPFKKGELITNYEELIKECIDTMIANEDDHGYSKKRRLQLMTTWTLTKTKRKKTTEASVEGERLAGCKEN